MVLLGHKEPTTPHLLPEVGMVAIRTGPLQGKSCLQQCIRPSLQRAPVSRRRVVALAVPSIEDRQAPEQREEHNSSSSYVDANRTAEAVRSFDDAALSRGPSLQSAADLVRLLVNFPIMSGAASCCGEMSTLAHSFWAAESLLGFSATRGSLYEQACLIDRKEETIKTRVYARHKSRMFVVDRCEQHSVISSRAYFCPCRWQTCGVRIAGRLRQTRSKQRQSRASWAS